MVEIEKALEIIKAQPVQLDNEVVSLEKSLHRVLARDVKATFDLPAFDNSAMDGYALGSLEKVYSIVGEVAAGDSQSLSLKPGEAVRIFTGARLPKGAVAVIMQEKTVVSNDNLMLDVLPVKGQCIRQKGEELLKDDLIFKKGYKITPAGVGMLGSLGHNQINVFKLPVIELITTGNELVAPGQTLEPGQIYESNSAALEAALLSNGFPCAGKSQIKDDFQSIKDEIGRALQRTDVLILSGGISVGDYDFVKQALVENGVEELFYKVKQKPGKPLFFGRKDNKFIFALPGNPASSLSCFYIYVLSLLQRLVGQPGDGLLKLEMPVSASYDNKGDRPVFLKAALNSSRVEILDSQGSSMIGSMAIGNALAFLPANKKVNEGSPITVYMLS